MTSIAKRRRLILISFAVSCGSGNQLVDATRPSDANPDTTTDTGADAYVYGGPMVSCSGLAETCGPTGTSSCCESPVVTGGTFFRSYDVGTDNLHTSTAYPATVSSFRLDKYEVTVGRFRQFVNGGYGTQQKPPPAGAGAHAQIPGSGWDSAWNTSLVADKTALMAAVKCQVTPTWTDAPGSNENRPMDCVDWYEAFAFCAWDGGFLPTVAEWNYAAAGGSEQRAYPWSNPPQSLTLDDSTYASYYVDTTKMCMGDGVMGCALTDLVPVGSKPAGDGKWGQSDLGGNVLEWMLDSSDYYPVPCNDCANLGGGGVVRGGFFSSEDFTLRGACRGSTTPLYRYGLGVRCARTP